MNTPIDSLVAVTVPTSTPINNVSQGSSFSDHERLFMKAVWLLKRIIYRQYERWKRKYNTKTYERILEAKTKIEALGWILGRTAVDWADFMINLHNMDFEEMLKCFPSPRKATQIEKENVKKDKESFKNLLYSYLKQPKDAVDAIFVTPINSATNTENNNSNAIVNNE